jgi:small subunit ribosomal protein S17
LTNQRRQRSPHAARTAPPPRAGAAARRLAGAMGGAQFIGRVVSNRMQKTVVVAVDYMAWLPKLKTYEKRTAKHFAHAEPADLEGAALDIGDVVRIKWVQRLSKHKHYRVSEVLRKARVYSPELGAAAAASREAAAAGGGGAAAGAVDVALAAYEAAQERVRRLREEYEQRFAGGGGGGGGGGAKAAGGGGGEAAGGGGGAGEASLGGPASEGGGSGGTVSSPAG